MGSNKANENLFLQFSAIIIRSITSNNKVTSFILTVPIFVDTARYQGHKNLIFTAQQIYYC